MQNRRKAILQAALNEDALGASIEESEDSLQFLWAVSYSDLLMVLMSFFIVYFSFTTPEGKTLMDEISKSFKSAPLAKNRLDPKTEGGTQSQDSAKGPSDLTSLAQPEKDLPITSPLLKEIQTKLRGENQAERDLNGMTALRIDLEDNAFSLGRYELSGTTKAEISELLKLIEPYKDRITLTFIGHSDQAPIRRLARESALQTNMNLSSLRAGSGVRFAISEGFDPRAIWTEGFAEFGRNTRSLSIRIKERVKP